MGAFNSSIDTVFTRDEIPAMVACAAARKQILACATWLVLQAIDEASGLEGLEHTRADYAKESRVGHASTSEGGLS